MEPPVPTFHEALEWLVALRSAAHKRSVRQVTRVITAVDIHVHKSVLSGCQFVVVVICILHVRAET